MRGYGVEAGAGAGSRRAVYGASWYSGSLLQRRQYGTGSRWAGMNDGSNAMAEAAEENDVWLAVRTEEDAIAVSSRVTMRRRLSWW